MKVQKRAITAQTIMVAYGALNMMIFDAVWGDQGESFDWNYLFISHNLDIWSKSILAWSSLPVSDTKQKISHLPNTDESSLILSLSLSLSLSEVRRRKCCICFPTWLEISIFLPSFPPLLLCLWWDIHLSSFLGQGEDVGRRRWTTKIECADSEFWLANKIVLGSHQRTLWLGYLLFANRA